MNDMAEDTRDINQLNEQAVEFGRWLGLLLASSKLPAEQKEAWLAVVPNMSPQQLADFARVLEKLIPDAEEQGFAELAEKLGAAEGRRVASIKAANAQAQKSLDEVEKDLRPPAL